MSVLSGALMKVIGLTGGIASGKSTVSSHLRSLGASVIDADKVAWELAEPGKAIWQAYRHRYGDEVINEDGTLNRQAVADRVFADKEELNWMNSMAHPLIKEEIGRRMSNIAQQPISAVVLDVPLLLESGWDALTDEVWLVYVSPGLQLKRLMERNDFSEAEARRRIASQMSMEEKLKMADVVIDNNGTLEELRRKVTEIWARSALNS